MTLNALSQSLTVGDQDMVRQLVNQALDEKIDPSVILNNGLIAGMDDVGEKFQKGEMFIPHMLLAARAMHAALEILKPRLVESGAKPKGKVLLGTVKADHHDIGKNLVAMMLEGKGFEVVDIGVDAPPEKFVQSVDEDIQIVGMSSLLSTTAPYLGETIEALDKAGLRNRIRIMVGGGVVTQTLADSLGADGFGQDAAVAAEVALKLIQTGHA